MKAFETMGSKRGKGKRGFTLIELLIVMVILAILAGVVVMAVGGIFGQAKSRAYDTIKPQIQNAVTAYTTANYGALPPYASPNYYTIVTEAGVNVTNCRIFQICTIVGVEQILRKVPDGCADTTGSSPNNFTNNSSCMATSSGQHYIWVMDPAGNVYSICDMGTDGFANGSTDMRDGFHNKSYYIQDYWP